jgi:hypothetical protein
VHIESVLQISERQHRAVREVQAHGVAYRAAATSGVGGGNDYDGYNEDFGIGIFDPLYSGLELFHSILLFFRISDRQLSIVGALGIEAEWRGGARLNSVTYNNNRIARIGAILKL